MNTPLYKDVLGEAWHALPQLIRQMHTVKGSHCAKGRGRVERGANLLSRLVGDILGFPNPANDVDILVTFSEEAGGESITRNYGGIILKTYQRAGFGKFDKFLLEKFGPFTLVLKIEGSKEGIAFHVEKVFFWKLALPPIIRPHVEARECVTKGRYHYFVCVSLPVLGRLIEYEGFLILEEKEKNERGFTYERADTHFDVV